MKNLSLLRNAIIFQSLNLVNKLENLKMYFRELSQMSSYRNPTCCCKFSNARPQTNKQTRELAKAWCGFLSITEYRIINCYFFLSFSMWACARL